MLLYFYASCISFSNILQTQILIKKLETLKGLGINTIKHFLTKLGVVETSSQNLARCLALSSTQIKELFGRRGEELVWPSCQTYLEHSTYENFVLVLLRVSQTKTRQISAKNVYPCLIFIYLRSFKRLLNKNIVDSCGIRTSIVRLEGDHADHLTSTTAHF